MKNNDLYGILRVVLLLLFLSIGLFIRTDTPHSTLTLNTVAFYFSRAEYLESTGHYLEYDNKTFAQYSYKENYPPFPAYIAVPIYKIVKPFGLDFKKFISYFPILIYLITFVVGFFLIADLFNYSTGLFFSALLSVIPVAIRSTIKNYYTEEALGILLIILSIYFLSKTKKFDLNFFLSFLFLTMLALTWQVFLLVDFSIFILFLLKIKHKKFLIIFTSLVLLQLVVGHIISIYFIGINYSPVYMIKEALITLKESHKDYFKIAFDRINLETPGIKQIFNEFGYFTSFLILIGFINLLFDFKDQKNQVVFVVGFVATLAFLISLKFRYFATGSLIIIGAIGSDSLLNFGLIKRNLKIIITIMLTAFFIFIILNKVAVPSCSISLETPENIEVGKYYPLTISVKNTKFNPKCDNLKGSKHVFGGLHFEIENATILNVSVTPSYSNVSPKYRVPYLNVNWVEVVFDCVLINQNETVSMWIMPKNKNIKMDYRCWLPKKYCKMETPVGLRPTYSVGWRNEDCLERNPKNGNLCSVAVNAGYLQKRDFYCLSKEIS